MKEMPPYITPVFPSRLQTTVSLPASKSISARALIINDLCGGGVHLEHLSDCDDTFVMRRALSERPAVMDIMAAGTAMRFLTARLCVASGAEHTLTGTERMRQRPIAVLVDALRSIGAEITYTEREGFPPLHIRGRRLRGGSITLPADVSSQYISALLMTGPVLSDGLTLRLEGDILSRPYIDMTLALMRRFGAQAAWSGADSIRVEAAPYRAEGTFRVEPDWSAASYWYEMTALSTDPAAEVRLPGLGRDSVQGDSRVAEWFTRLGVATEYDAGGVTLRKVAVSEEEAKTPFVVDFGQAPDLAQTFVVTCALQQRPFRFTGLQSLRIKETDRIAALVCELAKLGYDITADAAAMSYDGAVPRPVDAASISIDTYEDHRMAMSFAPCADRYPGLRIRHPEVVSKSYPAFWDDLHHMIHP